MSSTRDVLKEGQERVMTKKKTEQSTNSPASYGCDILLQDTTIQQAKDPSFPNDAYLIWYNLDGKDCIDLVRGTRVRIFDMYYDKYGPDVVQKIDFGYGKTNPKIWGYKQPEKKKKR
jgi:hypothetical protein